jgi:hypothetical protein
MASILDKVEPHAAALEAAGDAMHEAGIGNHPVRGHAAIAHRMAQDLRAQASVGRTAHEFNDGAVCASAAVDDEQTKRKLLGISRLLAQADVELPPSGAITMDALNAKLDASDLPTEKKILVKHTLLATGRLAA